MDAVFLGSRPKREEISLARGPTVMIAIVLLAVQMFTRDTSAAMDALAPRGPLMRRVNRPMMNSRPPL